MGEDGKQEVQVLHNWLWVIIPYGKFNEPLLSGYCKNCDTAFTKILNHDLHGALRLTIPMIPKWGCKNPMEGLGVT